MKNHMIFSSIIAPFIGIFIFLFIVVIILIIVRVSKKPRSAKEIGNSGENQVATMLAHLSELIGGYVINDVTIPYKDSHAQIDHIFF